MVKLSASIEVLISSSLFPINQGKEILPVCHLAMRTITSSPPVSFHIHKATPTTVSYKVSTRRHTNSCTGKTLHYAGVALRLMLASYCVLVCWMLWQKKLDPDASITFNRFVASSVILKSACALVHELPIQYMLVILVICFWSVVRRGYKGISFSQKRFPEQKNVIMKSKCNFSHRRDTPRPSRAWCADVDLGIYLYIYRFYQIHPGKSDSGYMDS